MVSVTIGNQTHKRNQHTKENSPEMSTTAIEIPGYLAGTWKIDPVHSDVAFTVRHMMVSKVRGHFTRFEGELVLAPDPLDSTVTATIDLSSIDTNNPTRDDDLRSANYLQIQTHPTMTYRSTGIRHSEDGFARDPYGGTRAGFSGTAEISRHDFGITTEIPMDGGGVVVGDKIQIFIEIEAVLAEPHPAG